jgi:methylmalonyl-CoA mutase
LGTTREPSFALNRDPLGRRARGLAPFASLPADLASLGRTARLFEGRFPRATTATVSTLPYHDAGADAADELAIALSTGALYLGALLDAGLSPERAASHLALRISSGRDTFLELCKLRALRLCWRKLVAAVTAVGASGSPGAPRALVHAVCSARTLTLRDPWVNMLRVTTQIFAAVLGGADLVTPASFDQASGPPSPLGRRVARNTGLVLREESFLGRVHDPAGGSYYLESLTDALAREAWRRFQAIEREGGVARALESGSLAARLEAAWGQRLKRLARRETAVVGVSEFANLGETLPRPLSGEGGVGQCPRQGPPGRLAGPSRRRGLRSASRQRRGQEKPTRGLAGHTWHLF